MNTTKALLITAVLTLIALPAFANKPAEAPQDARAAKVRAKVQRMLDKFDKNGDRMLDATELEAVAEHMMQRRAHLMQRFDKNGDGQLAPEERQAMKKARAGHRFDRLLERFDSNKDGALSRDEVSRATRPDGQPIRLQERFDAADANKDGRVSREEFFQAVRQMHGKGHKPRGQRGRHHGQ